MRLRVVDEDGGMSTVDLLVSMVVFSILMSAVTVFFIRFMGVAQASQDQADDTFSSGVVLESMQRTMALAVSPTSAIPAIESATDSSVTFYSHFYSGDTSPLGPVKFTYGYDAANKCIKETRVPASSASPMAWDSSGAVAKCIAPANTAPVFKYFDKPFVKNPDGTPVPPLALPAGGISAGSSPELRSTIKAVHGDFTVIDDSNEDTKSYTHSFRVTMVNELL